MRRGQAKLVEGIMAYEREYLEEMESLCKLHHVLRYYGLSRHGLSIRLLALVVLEDGETRTEKWVREDMESDPDGCYSEHELKSAIRLSRWLRTEFEKETRGHEVHG